MWAVIALLLAAAGAWIAFAWRPQIMGALTFARHCPSCGVPLARLTGPGERARSYEVLACTQCRNAVTAVHGAQSKMAYCPSCQQRALETPCQRMPDGPDGAPRVRIHEHCHVCGHEATLSLPSGTVGPAAADDRGPPSGKVIPFPKGRAQKD